MLKVFISLFSLRYSVVIHQQKTNRPKKHSREIAKSKSCQNHKSNFLITYHDLEQEKNQRGMTKALNSDHHQFYFRDQKSNLYVKMK